MSKINIAITKIISREINFLRPCVYTESGFMKCLRNGPLVDDQCVFVSSS